MNLIAILGLSALVGAAIVVLVRGVIQERRHRLDLTPAAYRRALSKWQRDYAAGRTTRRDFPSMPEWVAEETWKYQQRYGVWPEEKN